MLIVPLIKIIIKDHLANYYIFFFKSNIYKTEIIFISKGAREIILNGLRYSKLFMLYFRKHIVEPSTQG